MSFLGLLGKYMQDCYEYEKTLKKFGGIPPKEYGIILQNKRRKKKKRGRKK